MPAPRSTIPAVIRSPWRCCRIGSTAWWWPAKRTASTSSTILHTLMSLDRFSDLFATCDSSLALAAGALARIADDQGQAAFSDLAVAYREEFLKLRAHAKGELVDAGSLSVDDARAYLATSVLPRLAMLKVLVLPMGALWGDVPVAFAPDFWAGMPADRAAAAQYPLAPCEDTVSRSEPVSG